MASMATAPYWPSPPVRSSGLEGTSEIVEFVVSAVTMPATIACTVVASVTTIAKVDAATRVGPSGVALTEDVAPEATVNGKKARTGTLMARSQSRARKARRRRSAPADAPMRERLQDWRKKP